MKRIVLDTESSAVREFIDGLPIESDGVELELDGRVICRLLPVDAGPATDRERLVRDRWDLIRVAQERSKHMSPSAIDRAIETAIDEVRSRPHR